MVGLSNTWNWCIKCFSREQGVNIKFIDDASALPAGRPRRIPPPPLSGILILKSAKSNDWRQITGFPSTKIKTEALDMSIEDQIKNYIAENILFSEGPFPYGDDASFLREGILDSVGVMELVSYIESSFGIQIASHDVTPENFDSVTHLARFVRRKKKTDSAMAA